jgi:hypothetical protein
VNLSRSTLALLVLAALAAVNACSSNNSTPVAPTHTPTPTASPIATPTVVPTSTPSPGPATTTEPITPGSYNAFPTVGGYGAGIEFPTGSTPTNDPITLTTQITQPAGYPTAIPTGNPGAGTSPTAPWLTFKLENTLTLPSSSSSIYIALCGPYPAGTYYLALFDITAANEFLDSFQLTGSPASCTSSETAMVRRALSTRRLRPDATTLSTDLYYIGVFH